MNVARMLYVCMTQLGMTEAEAWKCTPRKFYLLYDECARFHGWKKRQEDESILDMI